MYIRNQRMFIVFLFNILFLFFIILDKILVNDTIGVKFYSYFNLNAKITELLKASDCKHVCYKFFFIRYINFNLL